MRSQAPFRAAHTRLPLTVTTSQDKGIFYWISPCHLRPAHDHHPSMSGLAFKSLMTYGAGTHFRAGPLEYSSLVPTVLYPFYLEVCVPKIPSAPARCTTPPSSTVSQECDGTCVPCYSHHRTRTIPFPVPFLPLSPRSLGTGTTGDGNGGHGAMATCRACQPESAAHSSPRPRPHSPQLEQNSI